MGEYEDPMVLAQPGAVPSKLASKPAPSGAPICDALVAMFERHLFVTDPIEEDAHRLLREIAEEVLWDMEDKGWGYLEIAQAKRPGGVHTEPLFPAPR